LYQQRETIIQDKPIFLYDCSKSLVDLCFMKYSIHAYHNKILKTKFLAVTNKGNYIALLTTTMVDEGGICRKMK